MVQAPRALTPHRSVRHFFGAELRAWRERRSLSQAALGALVLQSASEIGKVEKAERWPSDDLVKRCDEVLHTDGILGRLLPLLRQEQQAVRDLPAQRGSDANTWLSDLAAGGDPGTIELEFRARDAWAGDPEVVFAVARCQGRDHLVPLNRRSLLAAGATSAISGSRIFDLPAMDVSLAGRVGMAEVLQLEQATDMVAAFDLSHGGLLAVEQGRALLRWALNALDSDLSSTVRQRLFAAAGYLADRTGWAMFDGGFHDAATAMFDRGLRLAELAGDQDLQTQIRCDKAGQAVFLGHPQQALHLVEAIDDDSVAPALLAAVHGVRAEAHGVLGANDQVEAAIDKAEEVVTRPIARTPPRWLSTFRDEAGKHASAGYATYLLTRACEGQRSRAAGRNALARLSTATEKLAPTRARALLFARARLASLHLTHADGDLAVGTATARTVVEQVPVVRSARLSRELRALHLATARHDHRPEIRQVGQHLDRLIDQLM